MDVIPVYVGGKDELISAAQNLLRQMHPDLMGLFRRDLTRLERLDQVAARFVPLSMEWRRVQANSISAVSAAQP